MVNLYFPVVAKQIPRLKDAFNKHNIRFGMAQNIDEVERYWDVFSYHSASGVPASSMKMRYIRPTPTTWYHAPNDELYNKLRSNSMTAHGHCLYWGQYYATWLPDALKEAHNDDERLAILESYISQSFDYYSAWDGMDVVNEGYTAWGPWYQYLGKASIEFALHAAREVRGSKAIKIFYNGVFIGLPDERNDVLDLANRGVIDGVGLQWHRGAGVDEKVFIPPVVEFMQEIKHLGLITRMSEVTIKPNGNENDHAQKWVEAVDVALQCGVSEFVQWGICDNSGSWQGSSLMFDSQQKPKKAFHDVINYLVYNP